MKGFYKKKVIVISFCIFAFLYNVNCFALDTSPTGQTPDTQINKSSDIKYSVYLDTNKHKKDADKEVVINAGNEEYQGIKNCLLTAEEEAYTWQIDVPETGMYNIELKYLPVQGKNAAIERELLINGKEPFNEAGFLKFPRIWADKDKVFKTDYNGNQLRPEQVERFQWITRSISDPFGYYGEPLKFYFEKGKQMLSLKSVREPMVISTIRLYCQKSTESYSEYKKQNETKSKDTQELFIQAEHPFEKSDFSIYPYSDHTSAATSPQDVSKVLLNAIGNDKWQMPGQWISWQVDIKKDGLYKIITRYRQSIYDGVLVARKLYIDDAVPFTEAEGISFKSSSQWITEAFGNKGEPYLFYLSKGIHKITLEVALGSLAPHLRMVDESILKLNEIYRQILMITGPNPDIYRDYGFDTAIPNTLKAMSEQAKQLDKVAKALKSESGYTGSQVTILDRVIYQLNDMTKKPEDIAQLFIDFKSNIAALGTWVLTERQQPLELDYIELLPQKAPIPKAEEGFFSAFTFEIKSFISSFFVDYYSFSNQHEKVKPIKVWIPTGRDQAQIVRQLIDESFTPKTDIPVDLQLVGAGTLLPSVLAGKGPDVSLSNANTDPVNFAIRKAAVDLSKFPDYDSITKRFMDSAIVPYRFNGGTYALPETQSFLMMFYRTDILEQIGIEPPKTWDDFYKSVPEIAKHHMEIGFPNGYQGLQMFLYQMGGNFYNKRQDASTLDTQLTLNAFKTLTDLFTMYKFPTQFDFANRFRTGEMPISIGDYTLYNQLTVFAPEIRGLWRFVPLPGVIDQNGRINNSSPSTGTGVMMLRGVQNKANAWRFMDWYISGETQSRFGNEMEAVLGPSAKQPIANIEAMSKLPWSAAEYKNLMKQLDNAVGTPEVPGGYMIQRYVDFAFTNVINGRDSSKELLNAVSPVNDEITRKLNEFGLR